MLVRLTSLPPVLVALRMRPSQLKLVLIQSGMLLGLDAVADAMLPVTVVKMAPVPHPDVEEPWVARWDADSETFWFELAGLRLSQWEMPCASERGWFCGRDRDSNEFVWRQLSTGQTSDRCPPLAPAPWSTVWDAEMDAFFFERWWSWRFRVDLGRPASDASWLGVQLVRGCGPVRVHSC